jgi:hypothetical protein
MESHQKHQNLLMDNRLRRIENRLRRIEILFLKEINREKRIKKELDLLEKEERIIEGDQKKLEKEERSIIVEMKRVEEEELWNLEIRYNCKLKIMDDKNIITCEKVHRLCDIKVCPLWKKKK